MDAETKPQIDPALNSPLAPFGGERPDAPRWFHDAIDAPHERATVEVEGATVEWLAWGARGLPGLAMVHGGGANADWWRFIAPYLADRFRIVAPSLSGMGGSDHRARYSAPQHGREVVAAAAAAGIDGPLALIGHSYGGFPVAHVAMRHPDRVTQTILLDSPFARQFTLENADRPPHRIYPTLKAALARFRWAPRQPTLNPWIADFIARSSLKQADGGWRWKFDALLWPKFDPEGARPPISGIPGQLAYVGGQYSGLRPMFGEIRSQLPANGRFLELPEAYHHVMADQPIALVAMLRAILG